MKYIVLSLTAIFLTGCVRSTAQWVVDKTTPVESKVIDDNSSQDPGIIFNDTSADSWYVLFTIGGLIILICFVIPLCTKLDYTKIKNYFRKKDT